MRNKLLGAPRQLWRSHPELGLAMGWAVVFGGLWLAARVERRMGDLAAVQDLGRQLRDRFPQSAEALQYEQGRFDD